MNQSANIAYVDDVQVWDIHDPNPQLTVTTSGLAQIFDQADPGPPSAPIGAPNISSDTIATAQFNVTSTTIGPQFNTSAYAGTNVNYILAYDSGGPTTANKLVEHFSAEITPPASTTSLNYAQASANMSSGQISSGQPVTQFLLTSNFLTSNGLGGNTYGYGSVPITLQQTGQPTSYLNQLGGLVTYTLTDTHFEATAVTPLSSIGTLSIATRGGPYDSVQGPIWNVTTSGSIALIVKNTGVLDSGTMQVTTHYDAHFSA